MSTIEERVLKIVKEQLGIEDDQIPGNDASFVNDLGADSLDAVELVMALEEEFGLEIPDEQSQAIMTIQDVIDFVTSHNAAE